MKRCGFSLVEILVALVIAGVVGGASVRLLLQQQRALSSQLARSERGAAVRVAQAFFQTELGPVAARDGDLIAMDTDRVVYRGHRVTAFLCARPAPGSDLIVRTPPIGWRAIDPAVDSALIFAEGDVLTREDDRWVHADVTGSSAGPCDDGAPGLRVVLDGAGSQALGPVRWGAPVRFGSVHEVRLYRGGDGDWWLGERRNGKAAGWPTIQPLLGPLEPRGLEFRYLDSKGQPVSMSSDVALIEIAVQPAPSVPGPPVLAASRFRVTLRGR